MAVHPQRTAETSVTARKLTASFLRVYLALSLLWIPHTFVRGAPLKYMGPLIHNRIVPEGSSVDLSCELSDPSVQVTLWQMLRSGGMYTPKKNVVKWGQIFTLHRASKSIEGTYLCKSKQPRFTVGIGSVHVTPKPKDPPTPSVDQRTKTVLLNRDVNLTCKATGTRISSVQWYKWARKLSLQHQVVRKEASINGETWTNTLIFKNAQINRAGWYECRVFETGQSYGFWSKHEKLTVLDKTECPELDGDFADPQRTTGYLHCSGGISTRMNCSEGMEWRDDKKSCGIPAKVIRWESSGGFKKVAKTVGESVIFDCRLSDPNARVKLRQKVSSGVFIERFTGGCRLSRAGQKFVIHGVNFKDIGIYYCEAPQMKIRRKEEAFLDINPAPISALHQGYRNLFVTFGSSLDLNCGALNVFQPRMYLEIIRMDGITQITPDGYKVTLTDRIITIHGLDSSMRGKIVCKVVSSCAGTRADVDLGFLLPIPGKGTPPIPVVSLVTPVVKEGDNLVIKCSVSKDKEIHTIEWYKGKKRVTRNVVVMSAFESMLRINNVTKSDAGDYECRVTDFGVGYWHKSASVNVEDIDQFMTTPSQSTPVPITPSTQVTSAPPVIAIRPYQPVDISCDMFRPDMQLALWQEVSPGTVIQRIPDGISLIRQGNVFKISQGRSTDQGTYYCQTDGSRKVPSVALMHAGDGLSAPNKSVWIPNASRDIDYNGGANIVCIVQSLVPAHWSMWLKTDESGRTAKNLTDRHTVIAKTFRWLTELVLQIKNATEEDAGTYICRAAVGTDTEEHKARLTVKALAKAQVLLHSGSQVVNESQSASLWCKVEGSPQPKVTWQKLGQPVGECSLRWGALNCRSFSERHVVAFSKGTSFLRFATVNFHKDSGAYSCHVENLAGSENVTFQLTIQVKPSIVKNVSERIMIIQASDRVSLSCNIRHGTPSPVVLWWNQTCAKDNSECKPVSQGWARMETDNTSSLVIPPNQEHAVYRCTAENWLGHDDMLYTILRQPDVKPPNIINVVPRIFANASQTTKLVCETHDHAVFSDVEWFKDGAQVGSCTGRLQQNKTCRLHDDEAKYTITWTGSGAELKIKNVFHPFDSGNFTCVVSNAAGVDTTTITVDVLEKPILNKKNDTDFRVLAFGTATTIQSTALRGHPIPFFKWFQQPIRACASGCKPDAKKWRRVPRSVISPSAHVPSRMSSLFLPPARSGYFFRCIAENSLGHDDAVYLVHRIDTQAILPEITPNKAALYVDERSSFKLECQANAGDFQYLTWQKRNGDQPRSELEQNQHNLTNTLSVKHAQLEDTGDYLCVGWTNNDTKISVITVVVKEFIAPVVSLSNKTIHESQTNKTILRCAITSGYPKPNITWYKDGATLTLHALGPKDDCRINGYHYMERYGHPATEYLVICKPSHVQNTGLYKCVAENLVKKASSGGFLNVLAPPKIVNIKDTVVSDLGETVNVTCKATGNPIPSVKWVTKTEDGRHSSVTQSDDKNQTLKINSVQDHHYGEYVCVAENRFGNDTVAFALVKRTVGAVIGPQSSTKVTFIVAIVVSVALFILLLIAAAILYRRRQLYDGFYICNSPPLTDLIARLDSSIPLIEQVNKLPYDKRWEFPREQLQMGKVIGSGAFGEVYLAEVHGNIITDNSAAIAARPRLSLKKDLRRGSTASVKGPVNVAVKTLKEGADETEHKDLQSELKILIHIGSHKNIVNLLGACTKGRNCDLCVIIEYCPYGNMLLFLRNRREMYDPKWLPPTADPDKQLTMTDLLSASFQVARAMEFLASRKCVHRDLAARNVLVATNYVVKVADFGLARDVYKDDQYIKVSPGLVPVKWMAIESLTDRVYSEQSDVWSFGVFLWELFTLGGSPYPGLPPTEIYQFIMEGNRMDQPVDCPDQMYGMMRDCWMEKAADRPNFTALVQRLDNIIASNMTAMGHEGYLELGLDESIMPSEETDYDGYLKPAEIISPACNKHALLLNGSVDGSSKELRGSHRSVASESKVKALLEAERYTELGFKPSSSANTLAETIL